MNSISQGNNNFKCVLTVRIKGLRLSCNSSITIIYSIQESHNTVSFSTFLSSHGLQIVYFSIYNMVLGEDVYFSPLHTIWLACQMRLKSRPEGQLPDGLLSIHTFRWIQWPATVLTMASTDDNALFTLPSCWITWDLWLPGPYAQVGQIDERVLGFTLASWTV